MRINSRKLEAQRLYVCKSIQPLGLTIKYQLIRILNDYLYVSSTLNSHYYLLNIVTKKPFVFLNDNYTL